MCDFVFPSHLFAYTVHYGYIFKYLVSNVRVDSPSTYRPLPDSGTLVSSSGNTFEQCDLKKWY